MSRPIAFTASLAPLFLVVVALASCGGGDPAPETTAPVATVAEPSGTIVGADGVKTDITDPSRIVSMAGDITEIIFELGYGDNVVGIDVTTVYPPEAASLQIVGVGRFMNAEGALSQKPTLVIVDDQASPVAALDQIRSAGVPVLVLPVATTFEGLDEKIATLGLVFGDESGAQALSARIRADVADATAGVPTEGQLRVAYIYTRGPDLVLLFGEGMVSNPVIVAAGGIDAAVDSGIIESIAATPEAIFAADPDVIIVPEEGYSITGGLDEFIKIPGIAQTAAAENGRVYAYPEGDFLTFGPRVADSIRALVADLYP